MEDAALLRPEQAPPLVFTVDFITPIVDEPEIYGAISAANALSDVYAMGGEPQVALAICGFPEDELSHDVLARIFGGGRDKAAEANCAIVGGHTVIDPELKYGLCVIGRVEPDQTMTQLRGRAGDRLVLTKPIGTGIAAQAIKRGTLGDEDRARAVDSMLRLTRAAKDAALGAGVVAATDVTGFGLLGHLHQLGLASGVGARIEASRVPVFSFARELAADGQVPGGTKRNLEYIAAHTSWSGGVEPHERLLLCDAQTSGGLLLAVAPEREAALLEGLASAGVASFAAIGELVESTPGQIQVRGS